VIKYRSTEPGTVWVCRVDYGRSICSRGAGGLRWVLYSERHKLVGHKGASRDATLDRRIAGHGTPAKLVRYEGIMRLAEMVACMVEDMVHEEEGEPPEPVLTPPPEDIHPEGIPPAEDS
jgi:hypothetical protein